MRTTARIVEYSFALYLAVNNVIELLLQLFVGDPLSTSPLPYWLGPEAFSLYVPIIIANVLVLRYPDVSRRNVWVFCLVVYVFFPGFFIPILAFGPATDAWRTLSAVGVWIVAAGFAYVFITKDLFGRFVEYVRV